MPRAPEDCCAPTFTPSTKCEDFLRHHSQQLVKAAVPNGGAKLPHRRSLSPRAGTLFSDAVRGAQRVPLLLVLATPMLALVRTLLVCQSSTPLSNTVWLVTSTLVTVALVALWRAVPCIGRHFVRHTTRRMPMRASRSASPANTPTMAGTMAVDSLPMLPVLAP